MIRFANMNVRSQLVYVAAAITFVLGLVSLINPFFASRLLGLDILDLRGISQVRSTFGLMHLALGSLILRGAMRRPGSRAFLAASAMLVGAVTLGRLLSMFIDGAFTLLNFLFFLSEVVALVGILLAYTDPARREAPSQPVAGR